MKPSFPEEFLHKGRRSLCLLSSVALNLIHRQNCDKSGSFTLSPQDKLNDSMGSILHS